MIPLRDNLACKSAARVTFALMALNFVAFIVEVFLPESMQESFFQTFAVVPARISEAFASGDLGAMGMAVLSIFTAMFLHGGFGHIAGNMIFLQAYGKSVENRFGPWTYLLFYLTGGLIAWGFHFAVDPTSQIPALGASGAIAAVLGAYLLFYPKAEFRTLFLTPLPIMADVRAYWLLVVWFVSQLIPGVSEILAPTTGAGIAYWAHIGGFVGGLAIAAFFAWRKPESTDCYQPIECDCTCTKHGVREQFMALFNMDKRSCTQGCSDKSEKRLDFQLPTSPEPVQPVAGKAGCDGQCGGDCASCNGSCEGNAPADTSSNAPGAEPCSADCQCAASGACTGDCGCTDEGGKCGDSCPCTPRGEQAGCGCSH